MKAFEEKTERIRNLSRKSGLTIFIWIAPIQLHLI